MASNLREQPRIPSLIFFVFGTLKRLRRKGTLRPLCHMPARRGQQAIDDPIQDLVQGVQE